MSEFKNLIRERRAALGLSQRELAKAAGTSQQQIQRIESGVQAARLDLAAAVAAALNSSLTELFPKLSSSGSRAGKRRREKKAAPPISDEAFLEGGIDSDPRHWTVKVGYAGGKEFLYRVGAKEKERISSIIWAPPNGFDFVVFDTHTHRVAINRTKINYCNFLFDGFVESIKEHPEYAVTVHFIGTDAPEPFGVEPDQVNPLEDDQGGASQLQRLFIDIDGKGADEDEILQFDDEDGELVYLRSKQILCLEVPLLCCEPDLWRTYLDNIHDDDDEDHDDDKGVDEVDVDTDSDSGATK